MVTSAVPPVDEMVDGDGGVRPHWSGLLSLAYGLGREGLAERRALLARAASDEGFAGLLPGASALSWQCDPLPLPLAADEFAALCDGFAQRARLLEALLADLYGPQRLLGDGTLPAALVYANPGFLRPCRSTAPGQSPPLLHAYALDLIRGPDGAWRVLADLLARPVGAAFALENRRMLSRLCPELFRTQPLGRLTPFFEAWQEALRRLAPPDLANPGIALLTAGHREPTWSEHVLLARELSCALVESGDLTVRRGRLFLKTLRGLEPVDVLLRRVDGRVLDPLEMSADTALGIPGLFDAMRAGAVRIANDPGVSVVEAPGFGAFLPALAEALLGEALLLPAVETLWLDDPDSRARVAASPGDWLLRSSLDGNDPAIPADGPEAAALAERLAAKPWEFAASLRVPPSLSPCIGPDGMEPRAIVLRMFGVRDETCPGGWQIMQGGLARTLPEGEPPGRMLPRHTLAKDVWVLLDEVTDIAGPPPLVVPPLPLRRSQADLPARVADNFFWLGRHLERFEMEARLVRTALLRLARAAMTPRERVELQVLTDRLVQGGLIGAEHARGAGRTALLRVLLDAGGPDGPLRRQLGRVSRLVELLRDQLTGTMYSASAHLLRDVDAEFTRIADAGEGPRLDHMMQATRGVLDVAAMIAGLAAENMVLGGGRLFLDLGRRLERAETIAGEVAAALSPREGASRLAPIETGLRLVLELRDSVITYRARYLTTLQPAPVLDLVLADVTNPRALAFQLAAARALLLEVADDRPSPGEAPGIVATGGSAALADIPTRLLDQVQALVRGVLEAPNQTEAAAALPDRLRSLAHAISSLSERINHQYFTLLPAVHTVGAEPPPHRLRGAA